MNTSSAFPTRYDMATPHLEISRGEMPTPWQAIHDDLKKRGFPIAAENMREIIRMTNPRAFWSANATLRASI